MAAIIATNLVGFTVTYNGVQFGGADSNYKSTVPEYRFQGSMVYDDAGRAVIRNRYVLTVKTVFYEATEAALAANVAAVRDRLSSPGKLLKIDGMGTGFGSILNDIKWGPRPLDFAWQPLGQLAWECVWMVEFHVSECASQNLSGLEWVAWNFDTTWQNDFEGQVTRTIAGYVEIPGHRTAANPNIVQHVADEARNGVLITIPKFMRRVSNSWRESDDKTRLDFVVVDEQLGGDSYPPGITLASGHCSFDSVGPGFAKADLSMGMTLKTAPGVPNNLAGQIFMLAVMQKQGKVQMALNGAAAGDGGTVIPKRLSISNRKYDDSRVTEGSASWLMTKCLNAMLKAAGIWEPLTETNHDLWRASIDGLWGNRGNLGLQSLAGDDLIIDVCSGTTSRQFGNSPVVLTASKAADQFQFRCPEIPADGGWIQYDLMIQIRRTDNQTWHRMAVQYLPSPGDILQGISQTLETFNIGGPAYTQSASEEHVVEFHGMPEIQVLLQFKGLRMRHKPVAPELRTVGGLAAHYVDGDQDGPRVAFDIFECPAYFLRAWKLYRLNGNPQNIKIHGRPDSCAKPATTTQLQNH